MVFTEVEAWAIVYLAFEWTIRLVMIVIVPLRRSPEAARSWLLLVFFLPIPALLIYFLVGRPTYPMWRRERFLRLPKILAAASKEIAHSRFCRRPDLPGNLVGPALLIERLGQFPTLAGNDIELLSRYDDVIDRMIADIDEAQQTVHLLFYIFADDETGRRVMNALDRAARRGVDCRVLIDAIGSRPWAHRVAKQLAPAGVEVRLALRVGIFRRRSARADLRNHRKIAIIDSRVGYVGSQNIANADFRRGIVNEELVARVAGPVTTELQAVFIADWFLEADEELDAPALFPHHPPDAGVVAQVLPSGPDYPDAGIGELIVALVHGARERVVITTPYFVPDEALLQALKTAVLRGVEVHLVVSYLTDQYLVNFAQRSYYSELLLAGIKVLLYKGRFLHAKHVTFDCEIALLGSSNVDIRSFVLNAEVSLVAFDRGVVERLQRLQNRYFSASKALTLDDWEKRSVVHKVCENLARLASPLPSIQVVSRDRCGLYAQAVREGAPQAIQIADRFHLVQNLRLAIEEQMSLSGRATGRAILSEEDNVDAAVHRRHARLAHRQSREEVFTTIHALRSEGLSYCEIERRTGRKRRSVAKWLTFKTPPDRRRAALNATSPWYFEEFLAQCWKDGNRCGRHLFHDVKQRGYTGSFSNLERLLAAWRRSDKPTNTNPPAPALNLVRDPDSGHAISPVIAAALCIKPRGLLSAQQARKVDALKRGSHAFATMRSLAMRFNGILRGGRSEPLEAWIDDAVDSNLIPIMRFARVLRRDIDAVCNAI